jgi:hypothetical protein
LDLRLILDELFAQDVELLPVIGVAWAHRLDLSEKNCMDCDSLRRELVGEFYERVCGSSGFHVISPVWFSFVSLLAGAGGGPKDA